MRQEPNKPILKSHNYKINVLSKITKKEGKETSESIPKLKLLNQETKFSRLRALTKKPSTNKIILKSEKQSTPNDPFEKLKSIQDRKKLFRQIKTIKYYD